MEILQQEYYGAASFNLALFQEQSSFTEEQTNDAVNEVQNITAEYNVFDEEQVQTSLFFVQSGFNRIKATLVS